MTLLLKDPQAVLDYTIDWGAEYLNGDQLTQSVWQVTPDEPAGVAVLDSRFDEGLATVKAGGGIAGHIYRLTNEVSLGSGRIDQRTITVRVEQR